MKLDRDQIQKRSDLIDELHKAQNDLDEAAKDYSRVVDDAWHDMASAIADYNEKLEEARNWRDQLVADLNSEIEDKSEKWAESEKGQAAVQWKDEWDALDLDDIDIDEPDTALDTDFGSKADELEAVSEQPDE